MLRRIQTWNENGTAQFKPSRACGGPDTGLEYHSNIIITVVQLQIDRTVVIIPKLTVSQLVISNGNPQKKVRTKNGRIFSNSISLPFLQRHRYSAMAPFCLQATTCIQRHIRSALNTQLPVPILGGIAMAKGTIEYHRYHRSHKIDV